MNVGFVVTELLDGRFLPWEKCLQWESYLDLYCVALSKRGHRCVKYVPSIGVSETVAYTHKFGHEVKRVPAYSRLLAPKQLLRARAYEGGVTTIRRQFLGPPFTLNLYREARKDGIQLLHYSSYYSSFFIPAFAISRAVPMVAQYTGGSLPSGLVAKLAWRLILMPSLKASRAVLVGDYASERRSLVTELSVPNSKLADFNAPIIDEQVFMQGDKVSAQEQLGFDRRKKNILCVTYIPRRHSIALAKDPYLMLDTIQEAVKGGGEEIMVYVAGWGTGEEEFRSYIEAKGLEERVRFLGMIEHTSLPLYYSAADLVFLPFRLEKLNEGSVTIEAFASGRAVVAFKRHPGDRTEQSGGFLIEDDPKKGSRTLLALIRQKDYLEEKGREARLLSEQYTLGFAGERLEKIYQQALKGLA